MSQNEFFQRSSRKQPIEIRHQIIDYVPVLRLRVIFYDRISGKKLGKYQLAHSYHSQMRSSQRGFSTIDLVNVLEFGRKIEKQGMIFHIISFKDLPLHLAKFIKHKYQEWVVVTNLEENLIITCYKAQGALKRIRKKVKTLLEGEMSIQY